MKKCVLASIFWFFAVIIVSCSGSGNGGSGNGNEPLKCGNGTIETGETCDDGNTTPADGCSSSCAIEVLSVLLVDENGLIVEAVNITVNGGLHQGDTVSGAIISVDDFSGSADATTITITNRSDKELRLNDILTSNIKATDLLVTNDGTSDVVITGLIDNPVGHTFIVNNVGDIRCTTDGKLRSNKLTMTADEIGQAANRLVIELVLSPDGGTDFSAKANGDSFFTLTGVLRELSAENAVFKTGAIVAGGGIDLLLQAAQLSGTPIASRWEFGQLTAAAGVDVLVAAAGTTDTIVNVQANTDLLGSGQIDITANGNIDLVETAGDLVIGKILSNAGDVSLTSVAGSINDNAVANADDGTMAWVVGKNVILRAESGSIGSASDLLEIDSSHQIAGTVDAFSRDGVFFKEMQDDLNIGSVVSKNASVMLVTLSGSMLDSADDVKADIQGANIDLVVNGGGIGTDTNAIEIYGAGVGQEQNTMQIDPAVPGVGRLFVDAEGSVYLAEVSAALNVLKVTSHLGAVRVTVRDSAREHEDLNLIESGQTQLGQTISSGTISAPLAVEVWAGDDLTVPEGALISSILSVLIRGDSQATDGDPGHGTTIDIQGDLQAPSVEIAGGLDLDFLQINHPDGINAGSTTLMRGNEADDRLFVRAVAGTTTLQGDSGADRFYVSSNAVKSLFMGAGSFDDYSPPPISLLSGTLTYMGGLVIDTGSGGNGGTRDGIYLSADLDTAGMSGSLNGSTVTGLGMTGVIRYNAASMTVLILELGSGNDALQVTDPSPNKAFIYGGPGNDTITGCALPNCVLYPD